MKQCTSCGKIEANNNVMYCSNCGAQLRLVNGGGGFTDRSAFVPPARKSRVLPIVLVTILCVLLIVLSVIATVFFMNKNSENSEVVSEKPNVVEVAGEEKEQKQSDVAVSQPVQPPAPQVVKPVAPAIPQVSKSDLELSVDYFVQSYVNAMNTGDSTYMLPYVIPGSPIYNTQKNFIKNAWYEEYIDSYIIGDVKMENENTCVVSVYEIYNVQKPGKNLVRTEQTAPYRMKRDSDGVWKMYDFAGQVKSH